MPSEPPLLVQNRSPVEEDPPRIASNVPLHGAASSTAGLLVETMMPDDGPEHFSCNRAKRNLAPHKDLAGWTKTTETATIESFTKTTVTIGGRTFHCNTTRVPCSDYADDHFGDTLPNVPTVLTGCDWKQQQQQGHSTVEDDMARRYSQLVSLDGGPAFARMSMSSTKVTLREYQRYCANNADGDATPLYVFDPDFLKPGSKFDDTDDCVMDNMLKVPPCFSHDEMDCCTGSTYRPLPPAWLLVGVKYSGTPIHNHPWTVAWNALLSGCKLWCCLPPDVPERYLLLNLDDEDDGSNDDDDGDDEVEPVAFDISALEWFEQCGEMPEHAHIVVQHPGEVVFLPAGWFHVVLNVELSTALSFSLALRKDVPKLMPLLKAADPEFAAFWLEQLAKEGRRLPDIDDVVRQPD